MTVADPQRTRAGAVAWAFATVGCALALGAALLGTAHLPMADLPQHAAQVALWARMDDPAVARIYELNWLTPNLGAYALARLFTLALPLDRALACVVVLALLATPVVVARELRRAGGDPRWALALVPLGFTMVFYWGLLNFLVGLPLVPWVLGAARRHAERPSRRGAFGLAALLGLLLAAHVLLFAFASAAALLALALRQRLSVRAAWPLVALWPAAIAWLLVTRHAEALAQEGVAWHFSFARLVQLPREVLGLSAGVEPVQLVCALALLASPFALGARPARDAARWAAALLAAVLFLVLPFRAFGNACLYPRFAALVAPCALLALERGPRALAPRLWAVVPLLVLVSLGSVGLRLRAFDAEARAVEPLLARLPPGRTLLGLALQPFSALSASPAFEHLAMWHEARGGATTEPSFASRYPMLVRYRAGAAHLPAEWDPRSFRWARDGRFDAYLVRAPVDVSAVLFPGAPVRLTARSGELWLYER